VKTVKPLRLSVITRPFLRAGHQRLGVTAMGMVAMDDMGEMGEMGEGPVLLPEPEFWKAVSEELGPPACSTSACPRPAPNSSRPAMPTRTTRKKRPPAPSR
jgi:hypothetical protein